MSSRKARTAVPGGARKRRGGFPCPDCSFVAQHAMGLGRHRSSRHGVVSQRQRRRASAAPAAWITREQAAQQAGVHYNTIRHWEHAGLLRRTKRAGTRGSLVSVVDLSRVLAQRSGGPPTTFGAGEASAIAALERRFSQLIEGLELLIASVKAPARGGSKGAKRGPGAPSPSKRAGSRTLRRPTRRR